MNAGGGTDGRQCLSGVSDSQKLITEAGAGMDGSLWASTGAGDTGSLCFEAGGAGGSGT